MLSTQTAANTILKLAFEENISVTPMKLQKLLYFVYKDYLKETNKPLFSERFQKWQYGPVLASVYYEFNCFGANPIKKFARNAMNSIETVNLRYKSFATDSIKKVWSQYKNYSGPELSSLTHRANTAWAKAEENDFLSDEDIKNEE